MNYLDELALVAWQSAGSVNEKIHKASALITDALSSGHKILVCGNGGSATDAQHFAAEFVGRYKNDRRALAAIGLSADLAIVTAVGNDYGFEFIFSRQIEAIGNPGDVLVVISTSGMSPNLIEAVATARTMGLRTITLTGEAAHEYLADADVWCRVPSSHTAHIQEIEIAILHAICEGVEQLLEVA